MPTKLTLYGGVNQIGGNKVLLQTGSAAERKSFLLDFGRDFDRCGRFFEEFLPPRSVRGIVDLLELGVVPKLPGIYRGDLFPSDYPPPAGDPIALSVLFLSHAHMDHAGHLSLIDPEVPVISSMMTAVTLKATQVCGASTFEREIAQYKIKELLWGGACASKPALASCGPQVSRRFLVAGDAGRIPTVHTPSSREVTPSPAPEPPALHAQAEIIQPGALTLHPTAAHAQKPLFDVNSQFWTKSFTSTDLVAVPLEPAGEAIDGVNFRAWPVDHSVLGATAFAIETDAGWVGYTGDFRVHGWGGFLSRRMIEEMASLKPVALVIEGTNMDETGGLSENEVYENCLAHTRGAAGRLVVGDFGPRNVERLLTFLQIARETDRTLAVTMKDAFLLQAMGSVVPGCPQVGSDSSLGVFEELTAREMVWQREMGDVVGPNLVTADDISLAPGDYLLAMSFWGLKHLLDVRPAASAGTNTPEAPTGGPTGGLTGAGPSTAAGPPRLDGIYIYSTSEAFTEEMEMDTWRLNNWLTFLGLTPVGFRFPESVSPNERARPIFEPGTHSSGHASGPDLMEAVRRINPRVVIPIHTENPQAFVDQLGADFDVRVPVEGRPIELR